MIILIGFIETLFIAMISVLLGVALAYKLFEVDLVKQMTKLNEED